MARTQFNNIEKILSSGGPETPPLDMRQFIKLADAEKFEFDALNERLELLNEAWLEQRQPGESFDSWFKRTPREEILRITLSGGGRVGLNEGGSTASERYEAKIKELTDKGLSRELAEALIISELSPDAYRILEKKNGGKVSRWIASLTTRKVAPQTKAVISRPNCAIVFLFFSIDNCSNSK